MSTIVPGWARLLRIACSLIRQVNAEHRIVDSWSLGGGTALMLQIDHRQSDDIDIFLPDPQLLPYLDPKTHDFSFEVKPADYRGDGANFLKLAFDDIGEIDFIVGGVLTPNPAVRRTIDGEPVDLDTVAEIIVKKIHYRGASIKPRDIFDIAASARHHRGAIVDALKHYRKDVAATLVALDRLKPNFVDATIAELDIKAPYKSIANTAFAAARELLRSV